MKLAMLGGTFDPPHNGHLYIAKTVHDTYDYDKIAFVPAFISPFKQDKCPSPSEHRMAMLNAMLQDKPDFYCEPFEVEKGGFSYTINTIEFLYQKFAQDITGRIGLIIGDDHLPRFSQWHRAETLQQLVEIIVVPRYATLQDLKNSRFKINHLQCSGLTVSSSEIRQAIQQKKNWRHLVPSAVSRYILEKKLYEEANT